MSNQKVMELKQKLEGIEAKINRLGTDYNRLKTENNRLKVEADILKKRLAEQEKVIGDLENKNVHLHIARPAEKSAAESGELRKKIDKYIKEIDRCIELLNS